MVITEKAINIDEYLAKFSLSTQNANNLDLCINGYITCGKLTMVNIIAGKNGVYN